MLIICSCSNTKILADGTKVLSKTYENRKYFNSETDGLIDPNCFYKQIDYYIADSNYKKIVFGLYGIVYFPRVCDNFV